MKYAAKPADKSACPTCHGKGMVPSGSKMAKGAMKKCPTCEGEGKMETKGEKGEE